MKRIFKICFLIVTVLFHSEKSFCQSDPAEYSTLVKKADSLYDEKEYRASAFAYSEAFKSLDWKGYPNDRYNAACSWSLAGFPDSAFFNLERIVAKSNFMEYDKIITDPDLNALHGDVRWKPLIENIKTNKEKAEALLNKPLVQELDSIYSDDQKYRLMIDDVASRNGRDSKEMKELWMMIGEKDSVNLIKVEVILDKYGWLGADEVGQQGNSALFLVIQHSDLHTQEKYLPMMKEAVRDNKARASELALLIDRIEMRNGRPQVYGSQITSKDGKYIVYEIIDEKNVNKRRAEVGLEPLENYAKHWNIDYKLPAK